MPSDKPYRPNVGLIIFNRNGEVLVGERLNVIGSWQFPQGGIDAGEDPKTAAWRELYEEVGISDAQLVHETAEWLYYDFPPSLNLTGGMATYRGQMQKWFLLYWDHPITDCNLEVHEREFTAVKFIPFGQCLDLIVDFKKGVYEQLVEIFSPAIANFLAKEAKE